MPNVDYQEREIIRLAELLIGYLAERVDDQQLKIAALRSAADILNHAVDRQVNLAHITQILRP